MPIMWNSSPQNSLTVVGIRGSTSIAVVVSPPGAVVSAEASPPQAARDARIAVSRMKVVKRFIGRFP